MSANHTRTPGALALSFQEVLTAAARFRWKRQEPRDATVFRQHCRQALDSGAQDAREAGYGPEDVRLASFAVTAYLDETILHAADPRFAAWLQHPLEAELFGTRGSAEAFYGNFREVLGRPDSPVTADLVDVFQTCLLLGFTGMFGPATGERKVLMQRAQAKLRQMRGPLTDFAPAWRIPGAPAVAVRPQPLSTAAPPPPDALVIDDLVRQAEARLALLAAGATLRERPTLLVLGEPGSVKTSTILHCGAAKHELAGEIFRNGNVTGTALANFWFARHAVVVEAAASLLPDRPKWTRLLERLRPAGTAGRAALVCFDAERLTRPNAADAVTRSAHYLRDHLEEYARAAGGPVPVYTLFTRMDRVHGFPEFVRKLSHDECARVMGATLAEFNAPGDSSAALATRLKEAYIGLYRSLALARTEVMSRASDGAKIEIAYEFPRELYKLKPLVVRFLSELCPPGSPAGPFLRGFYFSGARPIVIDQEAPAVAQAAAAERALSATSMFSTGLDATTSYVPAEPVGHARRKIPQWLFLGHLFNEVLLADYLASR